MRVTDGLTAAAFPEAAAALSDAFGIYPVPMSFTAQSLQRTCEADDVVLAACALARDADRRLLGVCLAAQRGEVGRIAAMGVIRDAHGQGVGRALGRAVLGSLRDRGARRVVLEALTVNHPALGLYEQHLGFSRQRRLIGFQRPAGGPVISQPQWDAATSGGDEPDSWQLASVARIARQRDELGSVAAVIPEHHPVARLLQASGFVESEIDQYELALSLD